MNMVKKYYVLLMLFSSVLFVYAYNFDGTSDLKIQKKLKVNNEVYRIPSSTSSIKDETSKTDISLKYQASSTDFSNITETTTSESESNTEYISHEKDTSSSEEYIISTDFSKNIETRTKPEESNTEYSSNEKDTSSEGLIYTISTEFSKNIEPESTTEDNSKDKYISFGDNAILNNFSKSIKITSEPGSAALTDKKYTSTEKYIVSTDFSKNIETRTKPEEFNTEYSSSEKDTSFEGLIYTISTEYSKNIEPESTTEDNSKDKYISFGDNIISNNFSKTIKTTTSEPESAALTDKKYTSSEEYTISTDVSKMSEPESTVDYTTNEKYTSSEEYTNNFEDYSTELTSTIETTTINICKTAELTQIDVTSNPFSLNVAWINSVNVENCGFIYNIQLTEVLFYNSTTDSSILINYLSACKLYDGTVSIIYYDEIIHTKKFSATTSEAVDQVEQLKTQVIESEFLISWLPSVRTTSCIKYYKWKHFEEGKLVDEGNVTTENVKITQPNGCLNNTFSVLAAINETFLSLPQNTVYINVHVNDPPIFESAKLDTTSAITEWTYQNLCDPQTFLVNFTSDNEHFSIIEKEFRLENNRIIAEVHDLLPFTNYSFQGAIKNEIGLSKWSDISPPFQTSVTEPDPPENLDIEQNENGFLNISWEEPQKWNGEKIFYILSIEFIKLQYTSIYGCPEIKPDKIQKELNYDDYYYYHDESIEPASLFTISLNAKSSGGIGPSTRKNISTMETIPDEPEVISYNFNENSLKNKYNVTLDVQWRTPCRINGNVTNYIVELINCSNKNNTDHHYIPVSSSRDYILTFENFLPDSCYTITVELHSKDNYSEKRFTVISPAGIPDILETVDIPIPNATIDNPETTANVYIKNDMFNATMGEIIYYAIIVAPAGCEENPTSDEYSLDNWPKVEGNELCSDESKAYQATKIEWNPFAENKANANSADVKVFVLGIEKQCTSEEFCNRPLTPNTKYSIKIRGFTRKGFSDTQLIYFNTASFVDGFQLGLILGLIVGILAIAFIIAAALFYTKGKLNFTGWPRMESTSNISPAPLPVPLKKFKTHYAKMIENSGKIKNEFQLLSTISSDVTLSTKTAMLPINRKKNRYINILPYDQTRVKLNDTSITAADYINASYIKGYSESNEYIATQGPTESTCSAFWQMIIEQNVKLIVMLTQFVESGKDKCHKYFPDLNDSHNYLNVISVECIEEELLTNYNRRTFKVSKGKETKIIIHLQFNLWPDFGVPHELGHIMEFNKIIKETRVKKPCLTVMHCSAGVGRTGTLIAVDILMQTIRDKRKVDIFGTVLNLRKQRMNMVQSEIQYEFLYKCVNYLLSDNSRNFRSSRSHSKIQLNQIEENHKSESNMLETLKL